jgi:hypothetical protein
MEGSCGEEEEKANTVTSPHPIPAESDPEDQYTDPEPDKVGETGGESVTAKPDVVVSESLESRNAMHMDVCEPSQGADTDTNDEVLKAEITAKMTEYIRVCRGLRLSFIPINVFQLLFINDLILMPFRVEIEQLLQRKS